MKLSQIKTVSQNIESGAWVDQLPNLPGITVKVRGTFNADYTRVAAEARGNMTDEQFSNPDVQRDLEIKLLHETILVDWKGIEDDDGNEVPYEPMLALKMLQDPDLTTFRRAVQFAGNVVAREGKQSLDADVKNS